MYQCIFRRNCFCSTVLEEVVLVNLRDMILGTHSCYHPKGLRSYGAGGISVKICEKCGYFELNVHHCSSLLLLVVPKCKDWENILFPFTCLICLIESWYAVNRCQNWHSKSKRIVSESSLSLHHQLFMCCIIVRINKYIWMLLVNIG